MNDIYESLVDAASMTTSFALLGGECDEFVRFLQLEWESFADDQKKDELKSMFYGHLNQYKKYRKEDERDWHEDFSGRDFNELIV